MSHRLRPLSRTLAWLLPWVVAVVHGALLGEWVIDDAGISFAYARSLAEGHGLVAQPGAAPVEGFSNPAWVALLAPLMVVGLFDPVYTPKILAAVLMAVAYGLLASIWPRGQRQSLLLATALACVSLQPGVVIWAASGLENSLYACLVTASVVVGRSVARAIPDGRTLWAGVGVGLALTLTRPDGVIFMAAPMLVATASHGLRARSYVLWHAALCGVGVLAVLLARHGYFGEWLPNTYHAKGTSTMARLWTSVPQFAILLGWLAAGRLLARRTRRQRWSMLLFGFGTVALLFALGFEKLMKASLPGLSFACMAVALTYLAFGRPRPLPRSLWAHLLLAAFVYKTLPQDWMPEHRFATPFLLLVPAVWLTSLPLRSPSWLAATVSVVLLLGMAGTAGYRTWRFCQAPTVPMQREQAVARRIDRLQSAIRVRRAVVLLADVGGPLWEDRFVVLDLGGLCDAELARSLLRDRRRFLRYLHQQRPHFILLHSVWAERADLGDLLQKDYAGLDGTPVGGRYASGLFVRQDLLQPGDLRRLREMR